MFPVSLFAKKKKRHRRVSLERARLPGRMKLRPEVAPLVQPFRKAGLLVVHALAVLVLVLSAFPKLPAIESCLGLMLLVGALHYIMSLYLVRFQREVLSNFSRCFAATGISLIILVAGRLAVWGDLPPAWIPVSMGTLLFTLILSQGFALNSSAFVLVCLGMIRYAAGITEIGPLIILLAGSAVAALTVARVRRRSTLIRVGFFIGLSHLIVAMGLSLFADGHLAWKSEVFTTVSQYLGQGILVGFLVSGILPVVEYLFGVTTDVSLLELSNQNEQMVLRKLLIEAPGTFHHSFIVGLLAEAGAERIGAHGLLCRVGSYFHDIGKMNKPHYYAENIDLSQSSHEKLPPEMSAMVIASHPKDSLELADYYDLPKCLRPFMLEHHGTSMIEYFFHRAKERAAEKGTAVDEEKFRYPGPKPQSKETAIVMLADTVEAAVRSLQNPTSSRIQTVVNELVMKKLQGAQLDECPLTLRDIREVEDAFTAVLIGIHHSRPVYPSATPSRPPQANGNSH